MDAGEFRLDATPEVQLEKSKRHDRSVKPPRNIGNVNVVRIESSKSGSQHGELGMEGINDGSKDVNMAFGIPFRMVNEEVSGDLMNTTIVGINSLEAGPTQNGNGPITICYLKIMLDYPYCYHSSPKYIYNSKR